MEDYRLQEQEDTAVQQEHLDLVDKAGQHLGLDKECMQDFELEVGTCLVPQEDTLDPLGILAG